MNQPKGIIAGSTRSLRYNTDDAEVVPPDAVVVTGFMPGRIAPKGIIAGSTRSLRGNADDAEVVPPARGVRSDWLYARTDQPKGIIAG